MTARYLGQADIARELGVTRHAVTVWRGRYDDFPQPDVLVGSIPGWAPGRMAEIRRWKDSRPGQGAGGGRKPGGRPS